MAELHTAKNQLEEATAVEEVGATDQLLLLPADMEVADPAVDTEVNQVEEEEEDTMEVIFLTVGLVIDILRTPCWIHVTEMSVKGYVLSVI